MASTITFVISFLMIFVGVMGIYGVGNGIPQITNTINQITGEWPTASTATCTFSSAGPTGSCSLLDTATLGLIWALESVGSIFYRIGAMFYLIYQMISIVSLLSGIPVLGPIMEAIFWIILAIFANSHIPGVGKGNQL